ncbi:Casein kinase II subunit beta [Tritrichomonas foetus]|uniref:Casein kinase II subunit beta n=1 Tax=Tritrichomonas foetus TaxID=1144522 RepID=A0A1J4KFP6_9EUKA|nr:Casein kinase II subunit beta [Tritrichomonas foetus]|eukprot:OHT09752.1 Casein kinase II subunit beta [Tritrichomonas foetus]
MPSWIDLFLNTPQGSLFVKITPEFLKEAANIPGIASEFNNIPEVLELILSQNVSELSTGYLQTHAELFYGMAHRRFLNTDKGRQAMIEKQKKGEFFKCPRMLCHNFTCVPVGITNDLNKDKVKMFCPNCTDVYNYDGQFPVDGGFFGPDWVHHLMNENPEIVSEELPETYIPRVFGFKVFIQANQPTS